MVASTSTRTHATRTAPIAPCAGTSARRSTRRRRVTERWAPTPEQETAIRVEGSAVVRAGAGCGKTAVLAERFVHLLRPRADGVPPPVGEVGEILAITFTEKAAAEMKQRIRAVVAEEVAGATDA